MKFFIAIKQNDCNFAVRFRREEGLEKRRTETSSLKVWGQHKPIPWGGVSRPEGMGDKERQAPRGGSRAGEGGTRDTEKTKQERQ